MYIQQSHQPAGFLVAFPGADDTVGPIDRLLMFVVAGGTLGVIPGFDDGALDVCEEQNEAQLVCETSESSERHWGEE